VKIMTERIKVFIAGDSTAAAKLPEKRPETGWGEKLPIYFSEEIEFLNHAVNGRSSKSFIEEGRLKVILDSIGEGDFLFIQFGHNDEKEDAERHTDPFTTYKAHLFKYIEGARKAGAIPVLLTSVHRRAFIEDGSLDDTHGDYLKAMRELAVEHNVQLIDIAEKSKVLFEKLGTEKTKEIFLWTEPGQSENYPEGVKDNTHFSDYGAGEIAKLVLEGILEKDIKPLSRLVLSREPLNI
jgi:lysophospholipase L1-like esterase